MTTEKKGASIVLTMLLTVFLASIFQARWLAIVSLLLVAVLMFFLSWQIGVKQQYQFLSINFGKTWAKFVSVLLILIGIGVIIGSVYVAINNIPMNL